MSRSVAPIYQLKVTLEGIHPAIWRRVQVPADITLQKLHRALQAVMGWEDYHLHEFAIGDREFGMLDPDFPEDGPEDERWVRLNRLVDRQGARFYYRYDFGDDWSHRLDLETILPRDPEAHYPRCLEGKRACPPEDVGGTPGYYEFLAVLRDPDDPEHEHMVAWSGGNFDPERFDLEAVNEALRRLR